MAEEMEQKPAEEHVALPTRKKRNLLWLWILITAIVVGGGVAAYSYRGAIKNKFWPTATPSASTSASVSPSSSAKISDSGITWITSRQKLDDLGLFKGTGVGVNDPGAGYTGTDYYKVATTSDGGEIILAIAKVETMGTQDDFHHFLKKGGIYYWLSENSDPVGGGGNYYTRTNSDTDNTLSLKSLILDKTITEGSTVLTQDPTASRSDAFVAETSAGDKIGSTKWGDLYLLKGSDINSTTGEAKTAQYYVLRNDGQRILYQPEPSFRNDDGSLSVTWSGTSGSGKTFSEIKTSGCGSGGASFPLVIDQTSLGAKTLAATTSAGAKIYTVSATSALANFAYGIYNMDGSSGKVSQVSMIADLGLLLWQDSFGNWIAFMNDKYAPAVECGKPVIYLYPQKTENVSVKVGATVTKSDPAYLNGWNVLANPSGMLSTGGKTYDSLFWEGSGIGTYPAITSGTVVASNKVAATIYSQLKSIGLNQKEISDFEAFWLPKMPQTPFVRLTWLTNDQMNVLAPLLVSPKPDSIIRVFLDFSGQQSASTNLSPQILPHYSRSGFSVVEWGGLLK